MKKFTLILTVLMCTVLMFAFSSCEKSSIEVSMENVKGDPVAMLAKIDNNGDEDLAAKITVNFYNADNEVIGNEVIEIPYFYAGDTVYDVIDFDMAYDSMDSSVETFEISDEAKSFYDNLTIDGDIDDKGVVSYRIGGGNGEEFSGYALVVYTNEDDKAIGYEFVQLKGKGIVEGKFKPFTKEAAGYMVSFHPYNMMAE